MGLGYSWRALAESLSESKAFAEADSAWARARELVAGEPDHLRSIAFYEGQAHTRHDRRPEAATADALEAWHITFADSDCLTVVESRGRAYDS